MNKASNKWGLPLEYMEMPEYFDAHNVDENTESRNSLIRKLLQQQNVKKVIDMTCGTGSQVFHLHKHGFDVIGSDFSAPLIEIAQSKAKKIEADIKFLKGDVRSLEIGMFDAVITIFNSIGHLTKDDFDQALTNIRDNLKDGGIYIFDILNLETIKNGNIEDLNMDIKKTINGVKVHNLQYSEIDKKTGILTCFDNYTISDQSGHEKILKNNFKLQLYTAKEISKKLEKNGFLLIQQYDIEGNSFDKCKSPNILTVAKKNS